MITRVLGGVLLATVPAALLAESTLDYLERALRAERMVPGVFIQQHRNFSGQKTQKVMVMRDGEGQSLVTILEPLNLQGVQSFDTGPVMHTFYPDNRMVQVRPWGSNQARIDPTLRMRLIQKNYKLESRKGPKIAGLLTTQIVATPLSREVPRRTIFFGRNTTNLLKIDLAVGKQASTVFEVLSQSPYSGTLQAPPSNGWQRERTWGPKPLGTDAQTRVLTRISPAIPKALPRGFEVVDSFYNGRDAENVFLITRVTDGFVLVNVLQGTSKVVPTISGTARAQSRGVAFVADGLAPMGLLEEILSAFTALRPQAAGWEPSLAALSFLN